MTTEHLAKQLAAIDRIASGVIDDAKLLSPDGRRFALDSLARVLGERARYAKTVREPT